jgi:hypothetical protein
MLGFPPRSLWTSTIDKIWILVLRELPKAKVLAWKPDNADFVDVTSTGTDGAHYVLENALILYERDSGLLPVVGVISTVAITVIKACDPIQARLPF